MLTLHKALKIIEKNKISLDTKIVPLDSAFNRILAEDAFSDINIPPFDKSAMDGYAVNSISTASVREIKGSVHAGETFTDSFEVNECVKIMTGAPIPSSADCVVKIEDTEEIPNNKVQINCSLNKGFNICKKAEDLKEGDRVLSKGIKIQGPEIAALASVGKDTCKVYKMPKAAIISTGNELIEPGDDLKNGCIRNSNGHMLSALAKDFGCEVSYLGIAKDTTNDLETKIKKGLESDILLLSGGVSMGDKDLVFSALKNQGVEILFHGVYIKPGKPLLFGKKGKTLVFGIPGNPVANFTTFHFFVRPVINQNMIKVQAYITHDFTKKKGRSLIVPTRYEYKSNKPKISAFNIMGSADITGCIGCNAFMLIEGKESAMIKEGELIEVYLL
ncbi:molybdopterin molybdotransferase MoeA [bacterium]